MKSESGCSFAITSQPFCIFLFLWSSSVTKRLDFFSTFLNCSEKILPVAFSKWFGPSASRTRARPVWSLRDKRATSHHHRQWHQLQTDQTSNSSSSGSRWAREEPKKAFGEKILKPPVRGYSISVYRFRGYPPSPFADQFLKGYLEGPLGRWFQGMHLKLKR